MTLSYASKKVFLLCASAQVTIIECLLLRFQQISVKNLFMLHVVTRHQGKNEYKSPGAHGAYILIGNAANKRSKPYDPNPHNHQALLWHSC